MDGFLHVGVKIILPSSKAHSMNFRMRMTNAILLTNTVYFKIVLEDWEVGLNE